MGDNIRCGRGGCRGGGLEKEDEKMAFGVNNCQGKDISREREREREILLF